MRIRSLEGRPAAHSVNGSVPAWRGLETHPVRGRVRENPLRTRPRAPSEGGIVELEVSGEGPIDPKPLGRPGTERPGPCPGRVSAGGNATAARGVPATPSQGPPPPPPDPPPPDPPPPPPVPPPPPLVFATTLTTTAPDSAPLAVSVTWMDWEPSVLSVTLKTWTPLSLLVKV